MLPRYLGQDPDTPTYMEALSCSNISYVRYYEGQQENSAEVLLLSFINWNIDDVVSYAYMIHDADYNRNIDTDVEVFAIIHQCRKT